MDSEKINEIRNLVVEKINNTCDRFADWMDIHMDIISDKTIILCNKIADRLYEINEANMERLATIIAYILIKTVLKEYMYNMMIYDMKHAEEDTPKGRV